MLSTQNFVCSSCILHDIVHFVILHFTPRLEQVSSRNRKGPIAQYSISPLISPLSKLKYPKLYYPQSVEKIYNVSPPSRELVITCLLIFCLSAWYDVATLSHIPFRSPPEQSPSRSPPCEETSNHCWNSGRLQRCIYSVSPFNKMAICHVTFALWSILQNLSFIIIIQR